MKDSLTYDLLISTYNWPQALRLCLQSVLYQTVKPQSILIADDGSQEETKIIIDEFRELIGLPVIHIWHEDKGFRKCKILNKAIAASSADYIIQIDGDVILHPKFIQDHINVARENYFVVGSRGPLKKEFSQQLLSYNNLPSITKLRVNSSGILNTLRNKFLSDYFKNRYKVRGKHTYYAKGCNMAFWKADIIAINGYNENLTGWGHEDEELVVRLINLGIKKQFLKLRGVVFHIWHELYSREKENYHYDVIDKTIQEKIKKCDEGIDQYLNAGG